MNPAVTARLALPCQASQWHWIPVRHTRRASLYRAPRFSPDNCSPDTFDEHMVKRRAYFISRRNTLMSQPHLSMSVCKGRRGYGIGSRCTGAGEREKTTTWWYVPKKKLSEVVTCNPWLCVMANVSQLIAEELNAVDVEGGSCVAEGATELQPREKTSSRPAATCSSIQMLQL